MTFFIGTFENKLDKKGRVSVPAAYRSMLADDSAFKGIVVFRSYRDEALEACSLEFIRRLHRSMNNSLNLFSDEQDDLATTILADAQQIGIDGDGRITLPPTFLDHAGLSDRVAFVGKGDLFQLWHPDTLEERKSAARANLRIKKPTLNVSNFQVQPAEKGDGR